MKRFILYFLMLLPFISFAQADADVNFVKENFVKKEYYIPMRDGIKLACDVYRPAAAGQTVPGAFPVILERTPYGKGQTSRSEISCHHPERPKSRQEVAAFFVQHGYVVVYQDCRGRYGSEGVFEK